MTTANRAMLKTMVAIAAVATLILMGANRIAMAQGAAPSAPAAPAPAADEPGTRSFTMVSVEVDDAKIWLPSVIAVEQGDTVKLTVTHEIDKTPSKLIDAVSGGWPAILSSLKSLLETGHALERANTVPQR